MIPSRQIQVVQNLEGGIVAAILVREGEMVDEGQVVMRIDNIRAASDYREKRARYLALLAAAARLRGRGRGSGRSSSPPRSGRGARHGGQRAGAVRLAAGEAAGRARHPAPPGRAARAGAARAEDQARPARALGGAGQRGAAHQRAAGAAAGRRPSPISCRLQREVNDLRGELEQARLAVPRVEAAVREVATSASPAPCRPSARMRNAS